MLIPPATGLSIFGLRFGRALPCDIIYMACGLKKPQNNVNVWKKSETSAPVRGAILLHRAPPCVGRQHSKEAP